MDFQKFDLHPSVAAGVELQRSASTDGGVAGIGVCARQSQRSRRDCQTSRAAVLNSACEAAARAIRCSAVK